MKIQVCKRCKGDGFYRWRTENMDPCSNIAGGRPIVETIQWGNAVGPKVVAYEFQCRDCKGTGEIQWNRGRSLTPVQ